MEREVAFYNMASCSKGNRDAAGSDSRAPRPHPEEYDARGVQNFYRVVFCSVDINAVEHTITAVLPTVSGAPTVDGLY
jgi:hypothetical protein